MNVSFMPYGSAVRRGYEPASIPPIGKVDRSEYGSPQSPTGSTNPDTNNG